MAGNRPLRPGEQAPYAGAPAGGGGQKKKKRRPNQNASSGGMGGGGGGNMLPLGQHPGDGSGGGATQKGFDYSGISADPGAWLQGQMVKAGFDPFGTGAYNQFLNSTIVDPFVQGWNTYQTTHNNKNVSIEDYIASLGWAAPQGVVQADQFAMQTPGGKKKKVAQPNPVAPDTGGLWDLVQATIDRYSPQARGIYDSGKDRGGARWSVYV